MVSTRAYSLSSSWLIVSLFGVFLFFCGDGLGFDAAAAGAGPLGKSPSPIAGSVQQLLGRIDAARAAAPATAGVRLDLSALSNDILHVRRSGEVELVFHARGTVGAAEIGDLKAIGAKIVDTLRSPGMVQVWIAPELVESAAALPWVVAVTPPDYAHVNVFTSEGVALHNADVAQSQGITGAGVTVGVISNGVASLAQSQALGELPAVTVLAAGSGDEGTAMLEIVNDMAPGASLVFNATGGGTVGHVNAVNALVAAGVNVIAEDLAFDAEPAFEQGVVASTRESAAAAGISVHSSSGNRAQNHAERVLAIGTGSGPDGYNGPFTGCTYDPTNVVAIAPGGDTTFDVVLGNNNGNGSSFTLQWSEPRAIFPTAGQGGFTDLDLYVMDATGTQCLFESTAAQGFGVGDTIEQIATPAALGGTAVKLVVNVAGSFGAVAPPRLDLRWRGTQSQVDTPTAAGSDDPDKNYTGLAFVIGAVNALSGNLEGFSSAGPVDLEVTTMCPGGAPGPCNPGVAGPAAQSFQGLDFLGADGVSVSGVGGFGSGTCPGAMQGDCRFFGTSAAAPHTAACDALVRQLFGASASPATIRAHLAGTALDFPPTGEDSTTGAGQVDCFAALDPPQALCQNQTVSTDPGLCSAANVSVDAGSFDVGGGPITLSQSPAAPYDLGATLVTLTVTDADALHTSCQATVTVEDHEPPVLSNVPAAIQVEQTALDGTPVDVPLPTATDNCTTPVKVTSDAPPVFPLGTTTVTFTATDDSGNSSQASTTVTVVDTTPPDIHSVTAEPGSLWPPNHTLRPVTVSVDVSDICDAAPACQIVSVTSNEPVNGKGDGNTAPDWQITGDLTVDLRAERSGAGNGRVYTITVRCTDDSGNSSMKSMNVTVPHDQGA
jgi:Subtilase family/HYR domain